MFMLCLVGMWHAPAPSHHRLLPRANSCRALCSNPTAPTLRNPTFHSRHTFHPLPTHIPLLSRRTSHPFVVSTPALSDSSHVSFPDVRTKTFSTHVITKIAPTVRETGLFTHGRASLNFIIISMCTHCVAVPFLFDVWQGGALATEQHIDELFADWEQRNN